LVTYHNIKLRHNHKSSTWNIAVEDSNIAAVHKV